MTHKNKPEIKKLVDNLHLSTVNGIEKEDRLVFLLTSKLSLR